MTSRGGGPDPGAHGRRHRSPRRPGGRHEMRTPSDHRHETPAPPEPRDGAPTAPEPRDGARTAPEPRDDAPVPSEPRHDVPPTEHPIRSFFRENPQVLVLLVISLVLGIGTFLAVLFGLVTAGSDQTTGEPSGVILAAHTALASARWLIG